MAFDPLLWNCEEMNAAIYLESPYLFIFSPFFFSSDSQIRLCGHSHLFGFKQSKTKQHFREDAVDQWEVSNCRGPEFEPCEQNGQKRKKKWHP